MTELQVRGNASAEEVAAVVAAVTARAAGGPAGPRDPYARWRATRLAALRRPERVRGAQPG
ncbi:MAG TPA: acyl-CoA carboxylase epsilon subunit [Jatrophihabitans sp.]|nr:acyl-CoA carboxylase epsilon subunit [Jatrophihabitans sp.]